MYSVVLLAAGSGSRCNLGYNKVLHKINDKTLLEYTLEHFESEDIIIVVSENDFDDVSRMLPNYKIVLGGQTRQESVRNGVSQAKFQDVLVHDSARVFISRNVIDNVYRGLFKSNAVVPCVKVKDTLKTLNGKTVDRDNLLIAQTPQGVKRDLFLKYYGEAKCNVTDDVSIFEQLGEDVLIVEGDESNIKITTKEDIEYAEYKLGGYDAI